MLARELMSTIVSSVSPSDSAFKALNWMEVFRISHLPVIHNNIFLGIISDSAIFDSGIFNEPLEEIADRFLQYYVSPTNHLFEIIDLCAQAPLTVVPVIDPETRRYEGLITQTDLVKAFSIMVNSNVRGAILVTEMHINDYYLSQIAQIVESNDAKIVSLYVTHIPDSMRMKLTIRLNITDVSSILRTFERYNYEIQVIFEEEDAMADILKDRYELLMRYLKI
ncbi:MAG TPA: CBS domain-containing protein [Salinivirgaceae bacterium]|nr:CBS domain-containing protein [Salinivirgaceae bacterium]